MIGRLGSLTVNKSTFNGEEAPEAKRVWPSGTRNVFLAAADSIQS